MRALNFSDSNFNEEKFYVATVGQSPLWLRSVDMTYINTIGEVVPVVSWCAIPLLDSNDVVQAKYISLSEIVKRYLNLGSHTRVFEFESFEEMSSKIIEWSSVSFDFSKIQLN